MKTINEKIFAIDREWTTKYPSAKAGILVIKNIQNIDSHPDLDKHKFEIEIMLREKFNGFSRENLNELPIIKAYNNYYKNFGKTYHVRAQIESIINGKSLSSRSAVLTAMFMAEVKNMLLTAGHDYNTLNFPIHITIGNGKETFIDIRGTTKTVVEGDMIMSDGEGVLSSIILGPDSRTKLTPAVRDILFAVYAPADIEKGFVFSHLKDIEHYIKAFSPSSETDFIEVFEAS